MRDLVTLAIVLATALVLIPNSQDDQQAQARPFFRNIKTIAKCKDGRCPVDWTLDNPNAAPAVSLPKVGDTYAGGSKVVSVSETTTTTSTPRTVYRSQCYGRVQVVGASRATRWYPGKVATSPIRWANRVRINCMSRRAARGNRIAQRRCAATCGSGCGRY